MVQSVGAKAVFVTSTVAGKGPVLRRSLVQVTGMSSLTLICSGASQLKPTMAGSACPMTATRNPAEAWLLFGSRSTMWGSLMPMMSLSIVKSLKLGVVQWMVNCSTIGTGWFTGSVTWNVSPGGSMVQSVGATAILVTVTVTGKGPVLRRSLVQVTGMSSLTLICSGASQLKPT